MAFYEQIRHGFVCRFHPLVQLSALFFGACWIPMLVLLDSHMNHPKSLLITVNDYESPLNHCSLMTINDYKSLFIIPTKITIYHTHHL